MTYHFAATRLLTLWFWVSVTARSSYPIDADPEAATLSEMEDSKSSAEANLRLQQSDGVKSSESIPSFLVPELTLKCCWLLFLALLHRGPTVYINSTFKIRRI